MKKFLNIGILAVCFCPFVANGTQERRNSDPSQTVASQSPDINIEKGHHSDSEIPTIKIPAQLQEQINLSQERYRQGDRSDPTLLDKILADQLLLACKGTDDVRNAKDIYRKISILELEADSKHSLEDVEAMEVVSPFAANNPEYVSEIRDCYELLRMNKRYILWKKLAKLQQ